jgi:hypothetical protein
MPVDDLDDLLTHFGVPSHVEQAGNTGPQAIETLKEHLDAGQAVVMFVDASEYWAPGSAPDNSYHFVRVVDVDLDRGVATLSDSGIDSGKGEEVPLDKLEQAWDESNETTGAPSFSMVVSDSAEPDATAPTSAAADPTTLSESVAANELSAASPSQPDSGREVSSPQGPGLSLSPERPGISVPSSSFFDPRTGFVLIPLTIAAALGRRGSHGVQTEPS